jgi:hypothetical protein
MTFKPVSINSLLGAGPERWLGEAGMAGAWVGVPLKFECRHGELLWERDSGIEEFKPVDPKREREALDRFIRLAESEKGDRDIEEFVGLFGPLWLCAKHQLPAEHPLHPTSRLATLELLRQPDLFAKFSNVNRLSWRDFFCPPPFVELKPRTRLRYSEPVAAWRRLAVRARSLLEAATRLRAGEIPPPKLWEQIDGWGDDFPVLARTPVMTDPWYRLTDNVNWWLELGKVEPYLYRADRALQVGWRQRTAFALIGAQLMLAINRAANFNYLICAGCGLMKETRRPPLKGKRVGQSIARRDYCDDCRRKRIPVRDAKRDQRRRERINRLHNAGRSINQIASEVGVEVSQIKEVMAKTRKVHA